MFKITLVKWALFESRNIVNKIVICLTYIYIDIYTCQILKVLQMFFVGSCKAIRSAEEIYFWFKDGLK